MKPVKKFQINHYPLPFKYHKRRLSPTGKKSKVKSQVWMMMMIAASLMWAGAAEMPEQSKMTLKNHQNDSKQLT